MAINKFRLRPTSITVATEHGFNASDNYYYVISWENEIVLYRFAPIAHPFMLLLCELDIVLLRRDYPGSVVQAGDIDNRVKTIIDALRMPQSPNEIVANDKVPLEGETPFFVLLQDDNQLSGVRVKAETLLDPPIERTEYNLDTKVYIYVNLKPYVATWRNMSMF